MGVAIVADIIERFERRRCRPQYDRQIQLARALALEAARPVRSGRALPQGRPSLRIGQFRQPFFAGAGSGLAPGVDVVEHFRNLALDSCPFGGACEIAGVATLGSVFMMLLLVVGRNLNLLADDSTEHLQRPLTSFRG